MSVTGKPRLFLAILLAIGLVSSLRAEDRPRIADLPVIDRTADDFYQILVVGNRGLSASWEADPERVPIDGEFTLTLTLKNVANPTEVKKPPLATLPGFHDRFQIEAQSDPPPGELVIFRYRVRPRQRDIIEIPSLKLVYYRVDYPEGKRFQTTYARPIPLTVTAAEPRPQVTPIVPLEGPESFFTLAEESGSRIDLPEWGWLVPIAVVLPIAGLIRWRQRASQELSALYRQAARHARRRLTRALTQPDPLREIVTAMRDYQAERFPANQEPAELREFFTLADAARFGPDPVEPSQLAARAGQIVTAYERAD